MRLDLILLRHGEAFSDAAGGDHARALTVAGKQAATRAGEALAAKGFSEFVAVTSDARRAKETAAQVGAITGVNSWTEHDYLYLAGLSAISRAVADFDVDASTCAVIVGHNPGWSEAVMQLSGKYVSLGTAGAAWLRCDVADDWSTAIGLEGAWELIELF